MIINNVIAIDHDRLWQIGPGVRCIVNDKSYLYIGRGVDQLNKYLDESTGVVHHDDEEEFHVDEVLVGLEPDVDKLVQHQLRETLGLIDEGWSLGSENLNVKSEVDKLKALVAVKNVMEGVDE